MEGNIFYLYTTLRFLYLFINSIFILCFDKRMVILCCYKLLPSTPTWYTCPISLISIVKIGSNCLFFSFFQGAILTTMLATRNFSSKYDAQGKYLRPSSALLHGPRQTVLLYLPLNFTSPCFYIRINPLNNPTPTKLYLFLPGITYYFRLFVLHSRHIEDLFICLFALSKRCFIMR